MRVFWIIVLVVEKIRKMSWSYLQNISLVCLKWSILETITNIATSACQSFKKVIEITLLPRLKWNLAWEDLNHTREIVYHRAVLRQLLTIHFQLVMCTVPRVHVTGILYLKALLSSYSVMCSSWWSLSAMRVQWRVSCPQKLPFPLKGLPVPQDRQRP